MTFKITCENLEKARKIIDAAFDMCDAGGIDTFSVRAYGVWKPAFKSDKDKELVECPPEGLTLVNLWEDLNVAKLLVLGKGNMNLRPYKDAVITVNLLSIDYMEEEE